MHFKIWRSGEELSVFLLWILKPNFGVLINSVSSLPTSKLTPICPHSLPNLYYNAVSELILSHLFAKQRFRGSHIFPDSFYSTAPCRKTSTHYGLCSLCHAKNCNLLFSPFEALDYFVTTFIYALLLPLLCERAFSLPSMDIIAVIFLISNTSLLQSFTHNFKRFL